VLVVIKVRYLLVYA